jgi:asparagine synthase (glutamine-hydrolysing)
MINNIYKLPPGHYLICKEGKINIQKYWCLNFNPDNNKSINEFSEEFNYLFEDSVKLRMLSEVPLGAFLSGGIDSSSIVAMMARNSSRPVKTFSIGFKDGGYHDETKYAELIARMYKTEHTTFKVGSEMLEMMEKYVYHFDEPFADYAAFPTYIVSKLAKEHVTVVLTGDGGDEIFAGYDRYKNEKLADYYRYLPKFVRSGIISNLCKQSKKYFNPNTNIYSALEGIALRSDEADNPACKRYIERFRNFSESEIDELYGNNKMININLFSKLSNYWDLQSDNLTNRLNLDIHTSLPEDMLTKVDRVTMAVSLEARVPFLDYRIVELAAGIPSKYKLKGYELKHFLKYSFKNILPNEIIYRPKHGFSSPLDKWLREELREIVTDTLSEQNIISIGLFKYNYIKQLISDHFNSKRNNGLKIFMLMVLFLWIKRFNVRL